MAYAAKLLYSNNPFSSSGTPQPNGPPPSGAGIQWHALNALLASSLASEAGTCNRVVRVHTVHHDTM